LDTIKGGMVPDDLLPTKLTKNLKNDNWQLILIGSKYAVASDEVNAQVDSLKSIAKKYDSGSLLIGEAPATKDLIDVTAHDFNAVSIWSIGIIFVIIALVFKSASLPFILILVIYLGITVNMAIPFYMNRAVPFIAGIVIGTIQLGSTVDYAILETTRYLRNRGAGMDKKAAVEDAVQRSAKSIVVSAISFFAATFGVGMYSDIDVISSLCVLMARGAVISMGCVIFVLPSMLMMLDKLIMKTTKSTNKVETEA
ncbi:MMPL family transporter, partial [Galactobacillus timonensis]